MDDNILAFILRTMLRFFEQHQDLCPHEFQEEKTERNIKEDTVKKYYKCKICGFTDFITSSEEK